MNVASLELCKELYELSGWVTTVMQKYIRYQNVGSPNWLTMRVEEPIGGVDDNEVCPAYSLGDVYKYLPQDYYIVKTADHEWQGWNDEVGIYGSDGNYILGKNPEDAACKLTIELFKSGTLTRDSIREGQDE